MESELPGVGDILSSGTSVVLDNAGLLLAVWACTGLPARLFAMAVGFQVGLHGAQAKEVLREAFATHNWGVLGMIAAVAAVNVGLGVVGYAAALVLAARVLTGKAAGLADLLADGALSLFSILVASLLTGLAVGFGLVFLIIPGMYLIVRLCLSVCATVVEGQGGLHGVARGWQVTSGRFWETVGVFGAILGVGFVLGVAVVAAGLVLQLVGRASAGPLGALAAGLIVAPFQFLASAWGNACMVRYFLEASARTPRPA